MTKKHIISAKACLLTWVGLMAGFVLTLALSRTQLEAFYTPLAMVIAAVQTLGVMAYFMHARASSRLTWLFAVAGIYWLGILFVLGLSDYLSRGWLK
jgi:cytochrome c oxidase subunit 4